MKVLFLSSWFPTRIQPLNGDFVERHAVAVSEICPAAVIHVQPDDQLKGKLYEVVESTELGLQKIIIYFRRNRSRIKPWARLVNLFRYGRGYLTGAGRLYRKFGKPDIIHANIIYPSAILAWIWHIFTGIPYIISEHWTLYLTYDRSSIPAPFITRRAVKSASAVVPVTVDLGVALRRQGYANKFFFVPNVVDTEVFKPDPLSLNRGKLRFLHVSSMKEEQKNISAIIRTINRLAEIRRDFQFTFVGEAHLHHLALIDEQDLPEDMILFKGELTHAEVAGQMRHSDVFVMFSKIENLPCVILEALSSGLPVISSNVGGIREWVRPEHGLLVDPGNEDELLAAMIAMFDKHKMYDKAALHQYAIDNFSRKVIARKFHEIYLEAMNAARNV